MCFNIKLNIFQPLHYVPVLRYFEISIMQYWEFRRAEFVDISVFCVASIFMKYYYKTDSSQL